MQKDDKSFRGKKRRWPERENGLENWVNTQRGDGWGEVSKVQIQLNSKSYCLQFAKTVLVAYVAVEFYGYVCN